MKKVLALAALMTTSLAVCARAILPPEVCGLTGTLEERAAQCGMRREPDPGTGANWFLITRAPGGAEIWFQASVGILWTAIYDGKLGREAAAAYCAEPGAEFQRGLAHPWQLANNTQFQVADLQGLRRVPPFSALTSRGASVWSGSTEIIENGRMIKVQNSYGFRDGRFADEADTARPLPFLCTAQIR